MNGLAVLVSLAAIGVDYGWQPLADGQLEYIVQIEPGLLDELKDGEEIVSEILPEARNVRRFRIRVGTGNVPRTGHLREETTPGGLGPRSRSEGANGADPAGGAAVLPSRSRDESSASSSHTSPANDGENGNFGPNGFLKLPPPPSLLGPDGKSSVLTPSAGRSNRSGSAPEGSQDLLPPAVADRSSDGGSSEAPSSPPSGTEEVSPPSREGPLAPNESSSNTAPATPPRAGGGVYPPATGQGSASSGGSGNLVFPPGSESRQPSGGRPESGSTNPKPVTPVREPTPESGPPNPVRFGESGIKPPADNTRAKHGPRPSSSSSGRGPIEGGEEAEAQEPLLAKNKPDHEEQTSDAAAFKPSMDKETAEKLEPKPWMPLVLTSLALFASLAANAYLGWIALGIYRRYRDIVDQLHQARTSPA